MLKDLASDAGMSAAKAHRYLVSFQRIGLVTQDARTSRYDLGPASLKLGLASLARLDPVRLARERMPALMERIHHGGHRRLGQPRADHRALGGKRAVGHRQPAPGRRHAHAGLGHRALLRGLAAARGHGPAAGARVDKARRIQRKDLPLTPRP